MTLRPFLALGISAALLAGCATTAGPLPPTDVIRYHLGEPIPRGTIAVEPLSAARRPAWNSRPTPPRCRPNC